MARFSRVVEYPLGIISGLVKCSDGKHSELVEYPNAKCSKLLGRTWKLVGMCNGGKFNSVG